MRHWTLQPQNINELHQTVIWSPKINSKLLACVWGWLWCLRSERICLRTYLGLYRPKPRILSLLNVTLRMALKYWKLYFGDCSLDNNQWWLLNTTSWTCTSKSAHSDLVTVWSFIHTFYSNVHAITMSQNWTNCQVKVKCVINYTSGEFISLPMNSSCLWECSA